MSSEPFHVWEGVYESFEAAGGRPGVFSEPHWVERSRQKGLRLRDRARLPGFSPPTTSCHEYCIAMVVAMLQAKKPRVRVLEFGGSVGFSFSFIVDSLARPGDVEIHVVDNEGICAAGRDVFAGDSRISFHSSVPAGLQFDVVHFGSSIQYVSDWLAQIRAVTAPRPEFLVFDDLPAGDIASFVSLQNYYGEKIPHWFFDIRDFVDAVTRETGYRLCYKARYVGTILGKTGPLPMENFPKERRIENAYNLAFCAAADST